MIFIIEIYLHYPLYDTIYTITSKNRNQLYLLQNQLSWWMNHQGNLHVGSHLMHLLHSRNLYDRNHDLIHASICVGSISCRSCKIIIIYKALSPISSTSTEITIVLCTPEIFIKALAIIYMISICEEVECPKIFTCYRKLWRYSWLSVQSSLDSMSVQITSSLCRSKRLFLSITAQPIILTLIWR